MLQFSVLIGLYLKGYLVLFQRNYCKLISTQCTPRVFYSDKLSFTVALIPSLFPNSSFLYVRMEKLFFGCVDVNFGSPSDINLLVVHCILSKSANDYHLKLWTISFLKAIFCFSNSKRERETHRERERERERERTGGGGDANLIVSDSGDGW